MNVYAVAKKCMLQQRKAQKKQPTSATAGETATENVSCIWDEWELMVPKLRQKRERILEPKYTMTSNRKCFILGYYFRKKN